MWKQYLQFRYIVIALMTLVGLLLLAVVDTKPNLSITWMAIYQPEFVASYSWQQLIVILGDLRTGISPILAIFDIFILKMFGYQAALGIYIWVYRIALIAVYTIPIFLFSRTFIQKLISLIFGLIFLHATILVHVTNPVIYDILYPLSVMLFIGSLQKVITTNEQSLHLVKYSLLAGLFLSITELLRPFFLVIMPVVIALTYLHYRKFPIRYFIYFLLPILILSGGWHLKLLILNDGQIVWSNIGGYNLQRAWTYNLKWTKLPDDRSGIMVYDAELERSVAAELNTKAYYEGSQVLQGEFISYVIEKPLEAANWGIVLIKELLAPKTQMYGNGPDLLEMNLYRFTVNIATLIFIANLMNMLRRFLRHPIAEAENLDTILIVITVGTIIFLGIGDRGEEARFIFSILPLWVALSTITMERSTQYITHTIDKD